MGLKVGHLVKFKNKKTGVHSRRHSFDSVSMKFVGISISMKSRPCWKLGQVDGVRNQVTRSASIKRLCTSTL